MKYIESYTQFENRFKLASGEITIPRRNYSAMQMQNGKRRIIAVEVSQLEELRTQKIFLAIEKKQKGGIRILDSLPQKYQLTSDVVKEKEKKIGELKSQIAEVDSLKKENEKLKSQIAKSEMADASIDAVKELDKDTANLGEDNQGEEGK